MRTSTVHTRGARVLDDAERDDDAAAQGDRGDREGKYLVMFEFESGERRNQLFPEAGPAARQGSEEFMQWMGGPGSGPGEVGRVRNPDRYDL